MQFLFNLVNGLSLGSVYAIIALGYTMVYGIAKMLNFAHGDVIMVGAYVSFCAFQYWGLPPLPSILAAMIFCTVLGVIIERLAYRPLRQATSLAVLITAIGMSYLLQNIALLIFKSDPKNYPSGIVDIPGLSLFGGQLKISGVTLVTIVANIVIMLLLTLFINRTKLGKAMRCVSEDRGAAELMGISVNRTISAAPWPPSPVFCSAPPIRFLIPIPAPCPVSKPSPPPYSAESAPFPGRWWAACFWESSKSSDAPTFPPSWRTPSCSLC